MMEMRKKEFRVFVCLFCCGAMCAAAVAAAAEPVLKPADTSAVRPTSKLAGVWSSMMRCFKMENRSEMEDYECSVQDAYVYFDELLRKIVPTDDFESNMDELDRLLSEAAAFKGRPSMRLKGPAKLSAQVRANVAIDALFRLMSLRQVDDLDMAAKDRQQAIKNNGQVVVEARKRALGDESPTPRIDALIREAVRRQNERTG